MEVKHQKGAIAKVAVIKYFMERGYYVYDETMPTGPIDFVAVDPKNGNVRFVDVKTMSFRSSTSKQPNTMINRCPTSIQKKLGVEIIYFNHRNGSVKHAKKT